jgi:hypothetical protein
VYSHNDGPRKAKASIPSSYLGIYGGQSDMKMEVFRLLTLLNLVLCNLLIYACT